MNEITSVFGKGFRNKVTLYIPSTTDVDKPLAADAAGQYVSRAVRLLSEMYGGATAIPALGGWVDESSGKLVTEQVTLVYSFADKFTSDELVKIKHFVLTLKQELNQQAVSVEVNGKLILL